METKEEKKEESLCITRLIKNVIKAFQKSADRFTEKMNDYSIRRKMKILYLLCMLVPLIITDSVIFLLAVSADEKDNRHELQNIASAVEYSLTSKVEGAIRIATNIYTNPHVNEFLVWDYQSPLEYFIGYEAFRDVFFEGNLTGADYSISLYADNNGIINGSGFGRLDTVRDSKWYRYLQNSGQDEVLYAWFDDDGAPARSPKRRISLIRKLNMYDKNKHEKILKLDIDYSIMVQNLVNAKYSTGVYICTGDKILMSNEGHNNQGDDFKTFQTLKKVGYAKELTMYGQEINIYVMQKESSVYQILRNNVAILLLLVCINAILPAIFTKVLNTSFTRRLSELSTVFDQAEEGELKEIGSARGRDEIGNLMRNYNQMVVRMNDLIQTVYKDKLKKQEMDIARKNAELLALHSQINPHFLFNALESIRMHSVLKKETETAHMVEKLALMERQYVDWGTDSTTVIEELEFVEAYLELQKYRFGERLSYEIDVDEECKNEYLPRMTIATFVENACVHGIEKKSVPGWVFVRVSHREEELCVEVEDTGKGMDEEFLAQVRYKMAHAGIASLKTKNSVGIMNVCLRLRMVTNDRVHFELESEEGIGTIATIRIPLEYVKGR